MTRDGEDEFGVIRAARFRRVERWINVGSLRVAYVTQGMREGDLYRR